MTTFGDMLVQMAWIERQFQKLRKVVVCNRADEETVKAALKAIPSGFLCTVQTSEIPAPGQLYLIDQTATAISMPSLDELMDDQALQDIWRNLLASQEVQKRVAEATAPKRMLVTEPEDNHRKARCTGCRWTAVGGGEEIIQRLFDDHRCEDAQIEEDA